VSWRYLAVASEAVLRAGRIQRERYASGVTVEYKGEIDLVTEVDRACELAILETIRARYPEHDIVTEETDLERTGSRFVWFIDPLDGTVNFAHCYPFFSARWRSPWTARSWPGPSSIRCATSCSAPSAVRAHT
jgi:myo-inositol-1(or 4)-monophosphatase